MFFFLLDNLAPKFTFIQEVNAAYEEPCFSNVTFLSFFYISGWIGPLYPLEKLVKTYALL